MIRKRKHKIMIKTNRLDNFILIYFRLITVINLISFLTKYNCCIVIGIDQLEKTLCKSKACPNYSKCKIDENGFYAKCYCPYDCDLNNVNSMIDMFAFSMNFSTLNLDNTVIKTDQIVCGTDGKDYANFCQLQKQSCNENTDIKIAYLGKCGN